MRKLLSVRSRLVGSRAFDGILASTTCPTRAVMLTGFASHRVPSGMAALPVRDSDQVVEELAEAFVNMDQATLAEFQRRAAQRMAGDGAAIDLESMLLQAMGGGGEGSAPAAVATSSAVSASASAAPTAPPASAAAPAKKAVAKQSFDVTLKKYPAANKVKLIKELRAVCALPIPEAKAAVEKCPGVVAKNLTKDDAEKLKKLFVALGAEVELV